MRFIYSALLAAAVVFTGLAAAPCQAAIALPQPGGPIAATKAWVFSFKDFKTTEGAAANLLNDQMQVYVFESDEVFQTASGAQSLSGRINFMFTNAADSPGVKSSITEIFFSDGAYLAPPVLLVDQSTGVSYGTKKDSGELEKPPQMDSVWPKTTAYVGAQGDLSPEPTAEGGFMDNGVNHTDEWLIVSFNYVSGKSFDDVINGLRTDETPEDKTNPLFQIAAHVQSIGPQGLSDTYAMDGTSGKEIDDPTGASGGPGEVVPEPATIAIWGLGISIAALLRRRNRGARNELLVFCRIPVRKYASPANN